MASEDIKSAITSWCNTDDLQLVEDLTDPGSDFALGLRAAAGGGATVPVQVILERGADRVSIRTAANSAVGAGEARELLASRPALVSGHEPSGGEGPLVVGHVYIDGFNRNSFVQVVREVAKTAGLLNARSEGAADRPRVGAVAAGSGAASPSLAESTLPAESPAPAAAQRESWSPQPLPSAMPYGEAVQQTPTPQPLPAPSFGGSTQPQGGYAPLSGQAAPQAQPQPAGGGFAPTHAVPQQGMQAWAAPDPNGAVVATLGGGLPIQVTEVRGAWARVLCSNGWSGWVDGRIIGVAR